MKKIILFVCVHNAGRSQMAAAFFNHLSHGKTTGVSAGTQPADHINPVVVEVMQEIGIDISGSKPQLLTMDLVGQAGKMITMGCGADAGGLCPAGFLETEDWALDDPHGKPIEEVRIIRDEIQRRVKNLIDKLNDSRRKQAIRSRLDD